MWIRRLARWGWQAARALSRPSMVRSPRWSANAAPRRQRRREFRRLLGEPLEGRDLLAADFLYALEARSGVPAAGFGFSHAASNEFHVVANFAPYVTPYFLENYPDQYQSRYYGEVQVHDATTGDLLRTIQNPLPFGHPVFSNYYGFNNAFVTPNAFGYSLDIEENLILVGSPGWEGEFLHDAAGDDRDTGGRAFLFDAKTGVLLHTFDGSFIPEDTGSRNNDGFGRSVAIDGDRIVISASGPSYEDDEENQFDTDPGRVYVYSAITGNLLRVVDSPQPDPEETLDFGSTIGLSGDHLVVTQGTGEPNPFGPTLVYDVLTGSLLHELTIDGYRSAVAGNHMAIAAPPGTNFVNAATGAITQTVPSPLLDFDGDLLATGTFGFLNAPFQIEIRDFPSASVLYSVPAPPDFAEAYWEYNQIPRLFADRLLVPGRQGAASESVVFVYSLTPGSSNSPPSDLLLTNSSVAENSASDSVIGTLSAIDPDSPETFTYALTETADGRFQVVGNQLRVANGSLLDFETNLSHSVMVQVFDSAGNSYSEAFTIQVTNANDAPTNITLSPNAVPENSPAGTVVGLLTATDIDPNETLTFELLSTASGRFALSGNQIVVADGSLLNFEALAFHTVNVQVTDSAGNTYSEGQLILVTDVNEPITDLRLLDRKVVEQTPNGTLVAAIDNPSPRKFDHFGADSISNLAGSSTRLLVTSFQSPQAYLLDAETMEIVHALPDSPGITTSLALSDTYAAVGKVSHNIVRVFNAATGNLLLTLNAPQPPGAPTPNAGFGKSVAIFGNRLAVLENAHSQGTERVYIYDLGSGNLVHTLALPLSTSAPSLPSVLSLTANHLAVGQNQGSFGGGAVHVYDATSGAFLHTINNPTPAAFDGFGGQVKAVGNRILVGAASDDTTTVSGGAAYLFNATTGALLHTFFPSDPPPATGIFYGFTLDMTSDRIAIGSLGGTQVDLYNAATFALIQRAPGVVLSEEVFGSGVAFGGDSLFVGDRSSRGVEFSGEIQVFEAATGDLLPGIGVVDQDLADTYTYTLLDSAGGRFSLVNNQLFVANGAALDFEIATSHDITIQVSDAGSSSFTESFTVQVIDAQESPTGIAIDNSNVPESTVRAIHSQSPDGRSLGGEVAAAGEYILASEQFGVSLPIQKRVQVIDAASGQQLRTLTAPALNPTAAVPDGRFGDSFAISGNLAYIGASHTKVGNLDEAGAAYVFDITNGNLLFTLNSPTPTALGLFGATLSVSGNLLAVSAINESGGTIYLFNATTGQLLETVTNPTPAPLEAFGQFLALSGDTLVSSSRFENSGAPQSGVAYIFEFNPATANATLLQTLSNPTPEFDERFGSAVAVSGNLVAVKDSAAVAGNSNAGSVHLFDRVTGTFLRTIANPAPGATDQFGSELVIADDLVLASSFSDLGGSNNGRAYVFRANTGALVATIENPSPSADDEFAFQIAVSGSHIVVSAKGDDTDGQQRGLVYVFDLPIGQLVGTLNATDPDAGETFTYVLTDDAGGRFAIDGNQLVIADATKLNYEVAISHDVTVQVTDSAGNIFSKVFPIAVTPVNESPQDVALLGNSVPESQVRYLHNPTIGKQLSYGYTTAADGNLAVVGTNNLGAEVGESYVFNVTTGERLATLLSPSPEIGETFGASVAISGNLVVVTARNKDAGATNSGQAYVFNAATGALMHTLNPSTPVASSNFGTDAAISGNVVAVSTAGASAAVFLFDAVTGGLLATIPRPATATTSFGNSLDFSGNDLVVSDTSGRKSFVYEYSSSTQSVALTSTINLASSKFPYDAVVLGSVVAVGIPYNEGLGNGKGEVQIFDRLSGNLLRTIDNPFPHDDDQFGQLLAIQGNLLAVSAQGYDTTASNSGRVYLFEVATGNLVSTLANPTPNTNDFFSRLSFAGNTLVVGSLDGLDGAGKGLVYVYDLPHGAIAGNLATTDPDSGDSHSYTLVDDAEGRFSLVGNQIVVADPSRFDFETAPMHNVIVQVTDSTGLSTLEVFVIQVANTNEPPQNITFVGTSIAENSVNGALVSTLTTTDPDAASTTTYLLEDSAGGRFAISGNTIVVANSALLDFETANRHSVTVRATDAGGLFVLESFRINVLDGPEGFDFGDLPDSFGTTLAANGARHLFGGMRLGATTTSEPDGQPSANANLDAGDDGVTLPPVLIPGLTATFSVEASQPGRLDVFLDSVIDDGQFTEEERLTTGNGVILSAGTNAFTLSVPAATGVSGSRAIRFRFSFAGGLGPTGLANEGEVEDYRVNVAALLVNSVQLLPDPDLPGATLMYVTGSQSADTIVVAPFNGPLRATINGVNKSPLAPLSVSRIVIFSRSGNDDIRINNTAIPGYLDGGGNNDTIRGGNGPDRLFGRGGNDTIYGRAGDDEIFGGDGKDTLYGDAGLGYLFGEAGSDTLTGNGVLVGGVGSDTLYGNGHRNLLIGSEGADTIYGANANQGEIIIAGGMIHQSNLAVLQMMHNEWRKTAPVATRIANLNGTTPGGLNGTFYLNSSTLYADAQIDKIYNYGANNANLNDWVIRSLNDKKYLPKGIVVII